MIITAGGVPVSFDELGDGRAAVFLHGMPSSRHQMKHFYEPIFSKRSGWRRIYPDLPGMGKTPGLTGPATQDAMLDVVIDFIDQVAGDEPVVLVGASYGGYLALGYSVKRDDRLAGLMLSEPMVRVRAKRQVPEHTVLVENPTLLAELTEDEQFWPHVAVIQTREALEDFRTAIKPGFVAADQEFLGRLAENAEYTFDLQRETPVTVPTLILAGRQDSITGYRDIWDIIELFPHATLAILDRAGHGLTSEQPHLFRTLTEEFLDRCEM